MNTSKHTPGPWKCVDPHVIRGPKNVVVAKTLDSKEGYEIKQANAHLIAAAPAMYLELKEGLVLLEASHHDMVDMYGVDSLQAKTVWERIESTRNALAQAKGGE